MLDTLTMSLTLTWLLYNVLYQYHAALAARCDKSDMAE